MKYFRVYIIRKLLGLIENIFYEKKIIKFYKKIFFQNSLNYVIDVGVNRGQSIDLFQKINKNVKIYGFEPNPSLFDKLILKYSNNTKITIYNLGCSEDNGKKLFYENILDESSGFEEINYKSEWVKKKSKILGINSKNLIAKKYYVNVIALSEYLKPKQTIDLIKIDVEGHEYMVLKGLFKKYIDIRFIQFEVHNDNMYKNSIDYIKIVELLNDNGFFELKTIKHSFGDINDVIFQKNKK